MKIKPSADAIDWKKTVLIKEGIVAANFNPLLRSTATWSPAGVGPNINGNIAGKVSLQFLLPGSNIIRSGGRARIYSGS